ncbi:MAG: lysophospholipid acyltransferase family protein [Pseudomonadota bacterium]|nr:lysophospholipid acyltransferase family protein [Pseudomonadota bacterium]
MKRVANHVSWLDIPVIGAQARIGFLSKTEVKDWPLIGWMAEIADTLFIARGANQTGAVIPHIAERVRFGRRLVIFPEGTTTDGARLQRFHPRLLAAGQLSGVRVQPVALRYGTSAAPDPVAPFVGDDALLTHLARLVCHPGLRVRIHFLPPLDGRALSRGRISEHCRLAIARDLGIETSAHLSPPTNPAAVEPLVSSPSASLVEAT